jgi:hypothetical protein
MGSTKFSIPIDQDQVNNLLKYVEATQDETVKASIFSQLGHDCFYSRHLDR